MGRDVCAFCKKEILPPSRALRSRTSGIVLCEDCVRLTYKGLQDIKTKQPKKSGNKRMTPKQMKEELDKYIIGQDEAKVALSIAVYNHYKRMDIKSDVKLAKSNVLLLGPTGCGKTLLAQTVAKLLDVPFAIADCTTLTEAGYVGDDVENVLLKLIQAADNDIAKAERGIIFLDEIDKLAKVHVGASITKDPSGEGVQQALLKLIEGTLSNVPPQGGRKHPQQEMIQIDTSNILFIVGGAFVDLDKIIEHRVKDGSSIGFGKSAPTQAEKEQAAARLLKKLQPEDLLKFGLIPEFIGRVPIYAVLDELNEKTLKMILTEPKNAVVKQYKCLLEMDGVDLEFEPEAIDLIAQEAIKRKTGARALRSIVEEIMLDVMYDVPTKADMDKFTVTADMVRNRKNAELIKLPTKNEASKEITA